MKMIALAALALALAACGGAVQPSEPPTEQPTSLPTNSQLDCPDYVECHEP